jgi:hypothetical protein
LRFNRLTVNPGLRIELFNAYVPAQSSPAGQFVPARSFDKIENLPSWQDIAPRLGLVDDVFGDSKTALKVHVSKYMRAFSTVGFAQVYNPNVLQTDRRTWSDLNGGNRQDGVVPGGQRFRDRRNDSGRRRQAYQVVLRAPGSHGSFARVPSR